MSKQPIVFPNDAEAKAAGFATFNGCPHVCIDFNELAGRNDPSAGSPMLTVSVKLPWRDESVTLCLIKSITGEMECADVQFHNTMEEYKFPKGIIPWGGDKKKFVRRGIMFGPGCGDNRTEGNHLYGTLLTLLLNPRHYSLCMGAIKLPPKIKTKMKNEISIEDINSIGIAVEARKAGITTATKLGDNGKSGDARVTIYQLGDVRVADTNGDPVWEESDHAGFAELLESEGISL